MANQERRDPERGDSARRKKAGALAALFAGSLLAQLAAMTFGQRKKK